MTNYERIKNMSVDEFIEELYLNIPEDCCMEYMFGSWRTKSAMKQWLESEVEDDGEIFQNRGN